MSDALACPHCQADTLVTFGTLRPTASAERSTIARLPDKTAPYYRVNRWRCVRNHRHSAHVFESVNIDANA